MTSLRSRGGIEAIFASVALSSARSSAVYAAALASYVGLPAASPATSAAVMVRTIACALRGSCQTCGSPSPSSPGRTARPWLESTTGPSKPDALTVSASQASRPTPFSTTRSASANACRSAGDGS